MLKLIVFDCDGVMFDSKEANRVYYNDLLAAFHCPAMNEEELAYVHMHNVINSVNHIFRHHTGQDMDYVHRFRAKLDYTPYLKYMIMEPDLIDFLAYAKTGYKLAISTNRATTMHPLLEAFGLNGFFDKVMTASDVENPKPAPDALLEILDFFGCLSSETIYIGDSIIDRQHTEACSVPLIAFKNNDLPAEYHVDSFSEIVRLAPFSAL